jgi:hypothetical protein
MVTSKLTAIAIVVSTIVIIIAACSAAPVLETLLNTSPTPYPYIKTPPTYETLLSQYQINVTQGESFQIKVTVKSVINETRTFTPNVQLAGYSNAAWEPFKNSHQVYNSTFSQEQLILEPNSRASTTLTINIAQSAPVGRYLFYVTNVCLEVKINPKPN